MNQGNIYQPLPHPQRSIRLLSIVPGWPDDTIHVALVTVQDLRDAPAYIALSYVWGLTHAADPVFCNGVSMRVTKSLGDALHAFRPLPSSDPDEVRRHGVEVMSVDDVCHSSRHIWRDIACNKWEKPLESHAQTFFIWIDALCINQEDMEERSSQVKSMREIYQNAQTVRIWFGAELTHLSTDEASRDEPISSSSWLDKFLGRTRLSIYGDMLCVLSFIAQAFHNAKYKLSSHDESLPGFPPSNAPEWKMLRRFFQQPWFYRVWTVQEIAMAQDALLIVGDWELDWKAFSIALDYLYHSQYRYSLVWKSKAVWKLNIFDSSWTGLPLDSAVYMCRIKSEVDQRPLLMGLLSLGRIRGATQPVDHVFAVLNLSADWTAVDIGVTSKPYIEPDYAKSVARTFADVTTWLISFHRSLDVLSFVEYEAREDHPSCPSWVPVWSRKKRSCALAHGEHSWLPNLSALDSQRRKLLWDTGYNADLEEPMVYKLDDLINASILQARGLSLSSIAVVSDQLVPIGEDDNTLREEATTEEHRFIESVWELCEALITQHNNDQTLPSDELNVSQSTSTKPLLTAPYTTRDDIIDALILTLCANRDEDWKKRADLNPSTHHDAIAWLTHTLGPRFSQPSILNKALGLLTQRGDRHAFQACISLVCSWRRFFITESGHMGIAPLNTQKGDVVAVLFGSTIPFVLRPVQNEEVRNRYQLLGECYVHGVMDGELVEIWRRQLDGQAQAQTFEME